MKKSVLFLSSALLLTACNSDDMDATESDTAFEPGTYEVTADGYGGPIALSVEFSEEAIDEIEVIEHSETDGIGTNAIEQLPSQITEYQSLALDVVSGATITSEALFEGVQEAVSEAGGDVDTLYQEDIEQVSDLGEVNEATNVIVVGGGGAGLSAAVEAAQNGSEVILLEKTSALGGNTILAGGPLNAVDPERQQNLPPASEEAMDSVEALTEAEPRNDKHAQYMEELSNDLDEYYAEDEDYLFDSVALHILQTYEGGNYEGNIDFIEHLATHALETVEWLESNGVVWQEEISTVAGGLWPRAHIPENAAGGDYIRANEQLAEELGIEIILDAEVEHLMYESERVVGVTGSRPDGSDVIVTADQGVVIATGGFAANEEMRQEYDPDLSEELGTTNAPSITGDGIELAEAVNSSLIGMEYIQSLPLGTPGEGSLNSWVGGLGVEFYYQINQDGERFMAEDGRRDEMTQALLEQEDSLSYIISGENRETESGETTWGDDIEQLVEEEFVYRADTIEELAEQIDVPVENLVETHDNFNDYVESGEDPDYGRTLFGDPIVAPFYASPRTPTVHHTMGGIQIDLDTQVLDVNGNHIPGLYAAGEVTGGIHGANRLGGNALLDIHTFGRIAGENIANEDPVDVSGIIPEQENE